MKNEKLTAVTNKICELLKGSELDFSDSKILSENASRVVKADEVLVALDKKRTEYSDDIAISINGEFICENKYYDSIGVYTKMDIFWQLGQPLSNQPTEVIEFLFNVLNCE